MKMMLIVELVLAAAATGSLAYDNLGFNYNNLGCGFGGVDPLGGFASYGLGVPGILPGVSSPAREEEERVLTCQQTGQGVAFVINIGKRQPRKRHGFAAAPFLGAASFLHPSAVGVGYGNPFQSVGGGGGQGLNATIDIDTARLDVSQLGVIVVEQGFTSSPHCNPEEFTVGVSPASRERNSLFGGHIGAQLGSFGAYGLGAQVGIASPLAAFGFPQHFGFASKGGYGKQQETLSADGLLTMLDLDGQNSQQRSSIFLEKLDGYKNLKELAGRAVILCSRPDVESRGRAVCDGQIVACCTLGYDTVMRELVVGY